MHQSFSNIGNCLDVDKNHKPPRKVLVFMSSFDVYKFLKLKHIVIYSGLMDLSLEVLKPSIIQNLRCDWRKQKSNQISIISGLELEQKKLEKLSNRFTHHNRWGKRQIDRLNAKKMAKVGRRNIDINLPQNSGPPPNNIKTKHIKSNQRMELWKPPTIG